MNQFSLRRNELVSILIALAMLLAIGVFSGLDWIEYRQSRDEVLASRAIFEHTNTLLLAITDAETSQRGFLLTGDVRYLEPYETASRKIPEELAMLEQATESDNSMHARIQRLRALANGKLDEERRTIDLAKGNDLDGALATIRTGRGKELMDSIRRIAGEIHERERGFITGRTDLVRARSDRAHLISIASSAVLLLLLGLGAIAINTATSRREQLIADLDEERDRTAKVNDLLQTTLSSIGEGVLVTDATGLVTFLNRIAESLTGLREEEAAGRPVEEIFEIIDESTRAIAESPARLVLAGGRGVELTNHTILRRNAREPSGVSSEIPIDVSGAPIRTVAGEILGVVLVFRDVTSRRTAERERERLLDRAERFHAEAEQERSHLHSLFLQAPATINIHRGPDHIYELVHPFTRELLGGRDVIGLPARESPPYPAYLENLELAFNLGRPSTVHEVLVRRPGADGAESEIYLNCVFCPWRESEGGIAGVMTLAVDVTEQVRTKQAIEATEARLRETARLESLGVLAGGIAHDFNNLLVGVMGNASLALETLPASAPERRLIEDTIKASEKAALLTRQMLAYAGKGRFLLSAVDISALIEELLQLIQSSIPRSVALRTRLTSGLPIVEADVAQMQQVFMNLIINAAEACGEAPGTVTISTARLETAPDDVRAEFDPAEFPSGPCVRLEVSDNGIGMDQATRARIFDPFFTTKFTGRGLGLSAVLGIIRAHKGAIRVESEPGKGTTFSVFFPAAPGKRTPAPPVAAVSVTGSGTILVVDDEETIRRMARTTLERCGYQVLDADNGDAAVRMFKEHAGAIDAVILDLTMPHLSGQATLRELRRIDARVKVILSSGFNEAEATLSFEDGELAGFLQKPYSGASLANRVSSALRG